VTVVNAFDRQRRSLGSLHRPLRGRCRDGLRCARGVHPITALESEYSPGTRDPADFDTCRELGIGFVAFCSLRRGFLAGQFQRLDDLSANDFRRNCPRFQGENFTNNLAQVRRANDLAAAKGCTPGQLLLAWVGAG
jgi:aryl-alcohol dehydrogenase-like predicted oxidoreductase